MAPKEGTGPRHGVAQIHFEAGRSEAIFTRDSETRSYRDSKSAAGRKQSEVSDAESTTASRNLSRSLVDQRRNNKGTESLRLLRHTLQTCAPSVSR